MGISILSRLDARDRALFARWTIERSTASRRIWVVCTHLGGLWCIVALTAAPLFASGALHVVAVRAAICLAVSHAIVQVLKRNVLRARPAEGAVSLVAIPDEFSFPSGHATAAMAVAVVYAAAYPSLALPVLVIAAAVGFSRVCLGVHYPGDVLVGQAIAVITAIVALSVG